MMLIQLLRRCLLQLPLGWRTEESLCNVVLVVEPACTWIDATGDICGGDTAVAYIPQPLRALCHVHAAVANEIDNELGHNAIRVWL